MKQRTNRREESALAQIVQPFQRFAELEASSGILLLACTAAALIWANSDWSEHYASLWQTELALKLGEFVLAKSLVCWINDALMALFFFVVGLEIKREIIVGELSSLREAALPVFAALGGMIVPAAFYAVVNAGGPGTAGWGVPMATDIAFALGVLALLGTRAPAGLKVFLAALAIVDDLGAVLVITFFYTPEISRISLAVGGGILLVAVGANVLGVRRSLVYAVLGIGLWLAFLKSGVHATVAGVLLAMTIPARSRLNTREFLSVGRGILDEYERCGEHGEDVLLNEVRLAHLQALEVACAQAGTPLQRLEHALEPWVVFTIMPLFALANAGVFLRGSLSEGLQDLVSVGVMAGLVLGKPAGILLCSWLAVRSGVASLPTGVTWRQVCGVGCLAGIGFTMALFIANLAFGDTPLLYPAKLGILLGSLVAGATGWVILRGAPPRR